MYATLNKQGNAANKIPVWISRAIPSAPHDSGSWSVMVRMLEH